MKKVLLPFSVLALFVFTACQTAKVADKPSTTKTENQISQTQATPPKTDDHGDEAPRITLEVAKKDYDGGNVVFVDTRSAEQFNNEHIKDAINIPAGQAATRYKEIPVGKKIIAYCT